jgi:hypothetical protein
LGIDVKQNNRVSSNSFAIEKVARNTTCKFDYFFYMILADFEFREINKRGKKSLSIFRSVKGLGDHTDDYLSLFL